LHPNSAFRHDHRALPVRLIDEVGFCVVFLTTPNGSRMAHMPFVLPVDGKVAFHLARGDAMMRSTAQ
jgi:transcriptional regulator